MTNKIGILGEQTDNTVGTHTVYTVPVGKAAKGRLFFRGIAANTATIALIVNGITVAAPTAAAGADNIYSNLTNLVVNGSTTAPTGLSATTVVAPAPIDYYLSEGDTVQYTIGVVNFASIKVCFVGTEVDVA